MFYNFQDYIQYLQTLGFLAMQSRRQESPRRRTLSSASSTGSFKKVVVFCLNSFFVTTQIRCTLEFLFNINKDRFTTYFKTCGTGSLFWRVGRVCNVPLMPRLCKQTMHGPVCLSTPTPIPPQRYNTCHQFFQYFILY